MQGWAFFWERRVSYEENVGHCKSFINSKYNKALIFFLEGEGNEKVISINYGSCPSDKRPRGTVTVSQRHDSCC
jgi:hypothetical protein